MKLKLAENQDVDGAAAMELQGATDAVEGALFADEVHPHDVVDSMQDFGGVPVVDKTELTGKYDLTLEVAAVIPAAAKGAGD